MARLFAAGGATTGRRLVLLTTHAQDTLWDFAFRTTTSSWSGGNRRERRRRSTTTPTPAFASPSARRMRSLNVAVAAALALGEALRQIGRVGGATG